MTGFGAAEGVVGAASVSIEVRSVNHRFFSPSIKLPGEFSRWEGDVREALRRRIARGHVTLYARAARSGAGLAGLDEPRFARYVALLRELRERYALAGEVDLATVLRMPDVLAAPAPDEAEGSSADLVALVEAAADALLASRAEEGARLAAVLADRLAVVERSVEAIAARAPERLVEHRDRLRAAVRELAEGVAVDEQRLAQEVALLAERLDVQEEIDRFRSHITAFRDTLSAGGDPVGKRLGFLLQEMLREANTTGSKANDVAIIREVVLIKEELERLREQVENLE